MSTPQLPAVMPTEEEDLWALLESFWPYVEEDPWDLIDVNIDLEGLEIEQEVEPTFNFIVNHSSWYDDEEAEEEEEAEAEEAEREERLPLPLPFTTIYVPANVFRYLRARHENVPVNDLLIPNHNRERDDIHMTLRNLPRRA